MLRDFVPEVFRAPQQLHLTVEKTRKILSLIDSVQKVTKDVGETTSELRGGLLKPLLKGGGAAFGVLQILKFLMGLKPKRSEKNND